MFIVMHINNEWIKYFVSNNWNNLREYTKIENNTTYKIITKLNSYILNELKLIII